MDWLRVIHTPRCIKARSDATQYNSIGELFALDFWRRDIKHYERYMCDVMLISSFMFEIESREVKLE